MLGNTTMGTSKTSIRDSSGHEEQHSRSFHETPFDGLRTRALAKKLGQRFLDMAGGTNVGIANGGPKNTNDDN